MGFEDTFKALSDPVRRKILLNLKGGKMSAGEIGQAFDMSGATISYHLAQLKKARLVSETKYKNYIYYELNASVFEEMLLGSHNLEEKIMKSKINGLLFITTILCLMPLVLGLMVYGKLPEQVAVHFNSTGAADNYLPKAVAAFGLPVIFALINIFTHFRLNHDPKNDNISIRLKQAAKWALPLISVIVMPITLFLSMGAAIPLGTIVTAMVGLVIVICGNYLPKCKQNYTAGIKLPWTLNNEENWNKTHRLAGFVWVVCGVLFIANAFLSWAYGSAALLTVMVIVPPVYSYLLYRKQEARQV